MSDSTMTNKTPRSGWVALLILALSAIGLYVGTMSRGVFPGLPAKNLAWHLKLDYAPTLLDSIWGYLIRLLAWNPQGDIAFASGLLSVICGVAVVVLLAALMLRVRFKLHDPHDPDEMKREGQARVLSAVTAGLFMLFNIPFWVLATRSLPGTFHLLMLMVAVWFFSEYQRTGKTGWLYSLGLLWGVGITEFPTFLIFTPLAVVLVVRAMLQRAEFSWPVLIRAGLLTLVGLCLYLVNAWSLWADPVVRLRGFGSMGSVLWYIWRDQWHLIIAGPFILVTVLVAFPWGVIFLVPRKKPAWRYTAWQVLLRLAVLVLGLLALFYLDVFTILAKLKPGLVKDLPPLGLFFPLATPHLILAGCVGFVAGEFWVMGQARSHTGAGIGQPLRKLMAGIGFLMPLLAILAGVRNLPVADGRPGTSIDALAKVMVDALDGRDVLVSDGVMDDSLRLLAHQQGLNLKVITAPQSDSAVYREYLGTVFTNTRQQALLQVGLTAFMTDLLADDQGVLRIATVDITDPLREYGYLVPDRLIFRVEPAEHRLDLDHLHATQVPFWKQMEEFADHEVNRRNLAYGYRQYLLRLASKVANNLGFAEAERNQTAAAIEVFQQARRLYPDNISALLNLLTIAQAEKLPEEGEYQEAWKEFQSRRVDSRVMWSLATLYGYVHNTGFLVRHGMMWAVSGKPRLAEAELRRAAGTQAVNPAVKAFLGRAYLETGDLKRSADLYRQALEDNPTDAKSLLMLAGIAIRIEDFEQAEEWLTKAEAAGLSSEQLRFERAAIAVLQGKVDDALANLKALVKTDKENVRAWALLAFLTDDGSDPKTYEHALKTLSNLRGTSPEVRLTLAELYMNKKRWSDARSELDQVLRMNPCKVLAWEKLVMVDFHERKRDLAEDHVRVLLTLAPENYTGNLMLGSFQYARGQLALAESSYRAALKTRREPEVLNDLAYIIMLKGGAMEEARSLINEGLALEPSHPILLSTRGEINLREGRLDEAEQDLQQALSAMPENPQAMLLTAQLYAARGLEADALKLAETLAERASELPTEQQDELQKLIKRLR